MNAWRTVLVLTALALAGALCSRAVLAAKRIEFGPPTSSEEATKSPSGASEESKSGEEPRASKFLKEAAERAELPIVGQAFSATAQDLAPAAAPAATQGAETSAQAEATPPPAGEATAETTDQPKTEPTGKKPAETKPPKAAAVLLPEWVTGQPFADYKLVSLAGAVLAHPKGQKMRALLCEFATGEEAWGFWSVGRGEKAVYAGQAAAFGPPLRVWQGQFVAVLSLDPPDQRLDELRLTAFARTLCSLIPAGGKRPLAADWLPTTNQLTHTLTYFHAAGPVGGPAMNLSAATEGATAQYQVARVTTREFKETYGAPSAAPTGGPAPKAPQTTLERAVVVRYPSSEAALKAWDAFVAQYVGRDPTSGARGGRRDAFVGGGWNGIQMRGSICAFAIGAPTRNRAQILLLQALSRAG
jgi:hypothetical protein